MGLLRVPAHGTGEEVYQGARHTLPLGRMWLSCHLWTWVAASRCWHPTHSSAQTLPQVFSDLNSTTGFSPFLLYSVLEESGEVTSAELEKAGEKGASVPVRSR